MAAPTNMEFLNCLYGMKRACTKRIANAVTRGAIEEVHIHLKRRARIDEVIVEKGGDPMG